ncbi:MAG TPA: hypothetical protein VFD04_25975, partial [Actinomycetes bacterium]|nr:hypothetical protein [Actinomycetes bacterium]
MAGRVVGIGIVGFGWMGRVHARAYARLPHHFPDLPATPRLVAVADPVVDRLEAASRRPRRRTGPAGPCGAGSRRRRPR